MGSRFSRHGTMGYRWPKVCISQPPPPPVSPPVAWPTTRLYVDWSTDASYNWDPSAVHAHVPIDEVMLTGFYVNNSPPAPAIRVEVTYDAVGNAFTGLAASYGLGTDIVPFDPVPQPINGVPYDSGTLQANRTDGMGEIVGTIRLYS